MTEGGYLVLVAGHQDGALAQREFDEFLELVRGKQVRCEGAALVAKDADGLPRTVPVACTSYAGMDVGRDNGLVVDLAYEDKAPYAFTGTVKNVVFDLTPATHEDEQALHEHAQIQALGHGAAG